MKRSTINKLIFKLADRYIHLVEDIMLKAEEQELQKALENQKTSAFKKGLIEGYNKGSYNYD